MALCPGQLPNTVNLVPFRKHMAAAHRLLSGGPAAIDAARFLFIDVLGNVAVFFPIGLSLAGALGYLLPRHRVWATIALGATLSISIELIQLSIPGHATDVDDVLFNTIGAALGAVLLGVIQRSRLDGRTTNDQ
jgi:glycopeptide antibiotics resistance protein